MTLQLYRSTYTEWNQEKINYFLLYEKVVHISLVSDAVARPPLLRMPLVDMLWLFHFQGLGFKIYGSFNLRQFCSPQFRSAVTQRPLSITKRHLAHFQLISVRRGLHERSRSCCRRRRTSIYVFLAIHKNCISTSDRRGSLPTITTTTN